MNQEAPKLMPAAKSYLLILCTVLNGFIAAIYFAMQSSKDPLSAALSSRPVLILGAASVIAGACSLLAGLWRSDRGERWPLLVNGAAVAVLGSIYCFLVRYRVSILTVAALIAIMAISIAFLAWTAGRRLGREQRVFDQWFLLFAGGGGVVSALIFLAVALRWIKMIAGSHLDLLWLGFYFAFAALCMFGLSRFRAHKWIHVS